MRDLDRALADISHIRSLLAAGTMFRGFGPLVIAMTGLMALAMATAQSLWPHHLAPDTATMLLAWVAVAVLASLLVVVEMIARSHRHHGGLADKMILNAIEHFLPAGFAGATLYAVLVYYAPDTMWILPGLWQILVALGLFAAVRMLPGAIVLVAGWYFVAGVCVLILASFERTVSPWQMGAPFAIGQLLMAGILRFASGGVDADD